MKRTILVTGGTGFVAGWTIVRLLQRGERVRATVRDLAREAGLRATIATQVDAEDRLEVVAADLMSDTGWSDAAAGCSEVLHMASPLGGVDDAALVAAARDGTLRVLRAAVESAVKRVVLTSSTAACTPAEPLKRAITELDWTDADQPGLAAYRRSKTLAERAAWDFMADKQSELVTILPGAIFGPVLRPDQEGSVGILRQLLRGQPQALPRLGFNIADVRDLADLHVEALDRPGAAGHRFIAMGEALWYADVARILRERLGERAANVPTADLSDAEARALALTSPQMKSLLPLLGRSQAFDTEPARRVLGFTPRPAADTVADCGCSLVA